MKQRTSNGDLPTIVAAVVALIVAGGIIYGAVDAAIAPSSQDSNSPNATTQGPPASFERR